MKKRKEKTINQNWSKHSKAGLIAFVENNFKYILAAIAVIIAIIAVFFGESKLIYQQEPVTTNVKFNRLNYQITPEANLASVITANNYGDSVNYSVTIGEDTLDNWKILSNDGQNVYMIYGDYLKNSVVESIGITLEKNGDYAVYTNGTGPDLINVMNSSNWNSLLTPALQNAGADVTVTASPTLEQFVSSWNAKYPNDKLYTDTNANGYFIGLEENPTTYMVDISSKAGFANVAENQNLYFPHKSATDQDRCAGYWLSSLSGKSVNSVMVVYYGGNVNYGNRTGVNRAFRPVICLPSSLVGSQDGNGVWQLNLSGTTTTSDYAYTLAQAIEKAQTGVSTIKVLTGITETTAATVPATKSIVLDLNGKTTTFNIDAQSADTSAITNEGTLTITDNTQATEATDEYSYTFKDGTKLEIGGTLKSNKVAVTNNGTATIEGTANIHGTGNDTFTIVNDGTMTVESGTIRATNYSAIDNGEGTPASANITINDGTIISAGQGIRNFGSLSQQSNQTVTAQAVKITGGRFETLSNAIANLNTSTGLIYITGGDIVGAVRDGAATPTIYNGGNGKIIIEEDQSASTVITDYSTHCAIINAFATDATGITEIRSGTIIAKNAMGIINSQSGTLIIGTDEVAAGGTTSVSTTVPSITGATYGVNTISANSTFKFYDGIIKGAPGKSIRGTVTNKPQDYSVVYGTEIINNTTYETATLQKSIPDTIINTESMYVPGAQVRVDGIHNYSNSGVEGKNYETTTWADLSGNNNNGAVTLGSGKWGENYLEFDGSSSWVNLGTSMNNDDYQTLEATFSIDERKSYDQHIISNLQAGGGLIAVRPNSGDTPNIIYGGFRINGGYRTVKSSVEVQLNKIYHVLVTYDGVDIKLYINGEYAGKYTEDTEAIKNQTITSPTAYGGNATVMALGGNPAGNAIENSYFDGKIFSAAVYNRALTADEVVQNATASLAMAGGTVSTDNLTYTIRFPNAVTGFTADDITLTNGTKGTFTEVTAGQAYTLNAALSTNSTTTSAVTQRITIPQGAATVTSTSTPTSEASRTVAIAPSYQNTTTNKCYFNLQDAFNEVNAGETIQVLNSTMEPATTQTKGTSSSPVTLNLNGKTIGMTGTLTNSGYLTIDGTGTLATSAAVNLITNAGTLNIPSTGTISNTNTGAYRTISNTGTVNKTGTGTISSATIASTIEGGTINVSAGTVSVSNANHAIQTSTGSISITGGTISSTASCAIIIGGSGTLTVNESSGNTTRIEKSGSTAGATVQTGGSVTANITAGTIETLAGSSSAVINQGASGKVTIDGAIIKQSGTGCAILKENGTGNIEIKSGTVTASGWHTIYNNNATGTVTISGGTVENTGANFAVCNNAAGTIEISGGTIISASNVAVANISTGTISVSGGTISGTNGIYNSANGNINITGGTVIGSVEHGVRGYTGTVNISSNSSENIITIEGKTYGVSIYNNGTATIDGYVKINATNGKGVQVDGGILTIGNNQNAVSVNIPEIKGNEYGVRNINSTFNFYDGIIYAPTVANTISGTVTDKTTGYDIVNGSANYGGQEYKFATLALSTANYMLHDGTNVVNTYTTLKEAFDVVTDSSKEYRVNVLKDVTDASSATPTVASGKNVTLDLNSYTVTTSDIMKNNGTLTIVGTETGTFISTKAYDANNMDKCPAIANINGTLNITSGTVKSTQSRSIYNEGNTSYVNISGGKVESYNTTITNMGNSNDTNNPAVKVTAGILTSSHSNTISNANGCTGLIVLSGGRIENTATDNVGRPCVINYTGKVLINGDAVVTSVYARTVLQYQESGNIEIAGGTVENTYDGNIDGSVAVNLDGTGSITINGGTITSKSSYGVLNNSTSSSATITINGGIISGGATGGRCAVNNRNKGKINICGGNISSETGDAVYNGGLGETKMTGGYVESKSKAGFSVGNGTATITGGEITGASFGIWMSDTNTTTVTIGTQDDIVSNSSPIIRAYRTSGDARGLIIALGTLNFYDGIIMGKTAGIAKSGTPTLNPETNYTISPSITVTEAGKTYNANYLVGDYTINVDPNGGTYNNSTATQTYAANSATQLSVSTPTRDGYTFGGWLPVKEDHDATWVEVFYHNNNSGTELFSYASDWTEVKSTDGVYKYSILGQLEKFRASTSDEFEFLLEYDSIAGKYNRWRQTANPVTTRIANNADNVISTLGYRTDFTGGNIDWTTNSWKGIAQSTSTASTFIDGSPGGSTWFYAIGAAASFQMCSHLLLVC